MDDQQIPTDTVEKKPQLQRLREKPRVIGILTPIRGPLSQRMEIHGDEATLGRKGDSGFVISDNGASRLHAKITRSDDEFRIEDLGSRNGTYVDGVPILSCVLKRGDLIDIGMSTLVFDWAFEPNEQ